MVKNTISSLFFRTAAGFGLCTSLLLSFSAWSQVLPLELQPPKIKEPAKKAERSVLEKGQSNIAQDVYVELEHDDILREIDNKRRTKGIHQNDDEIEDESRRKYKALRESVFPNGKLEAASIIRASDVVPTMKVHVPNSAALQRLLNHPKVKAVYGEQEYVLYLRESLPMIGQPIVGSSGRIGTGTTVAIIDASITPSAFSCRAPGETNSLPLIGTSACKVSTYRYFGPVVPYNDQWFNGSHGTNVTGIVEGVAPGTKLAFLQVFYLVNGEPASNFDALSRAMEWVIANAKTNNITAANFSLGTTAPITSGVCYDSRFVSYFNRLRDVGVIPVAATGNNGDKSKLPEPACAPNVVSVSAVYDRDYSWVAPDCRSAPSATSVKAYEVVCWANSNSNVKLLAPGAIITARDVGHSGTSQAAPHVSGAIAVLRAPNGFPNEDLDTTILRMTSSGRRLVDKWNGVTIPFLELNKAISFTPAPTGYPSATVQSIINSILTAE